MDKLVRVSHKHLKSLSELYKGASWPHHALTTVTLNNHLRRIEQHPEFDEKIELLALNEDFKDGTFLLKNGPRLYFNSLEPPPYKRLDKALNLVDYKSDMALVAFRDVFRPIVLTMTARQKLEKTWENNTRCVFVPKEFVKSVPDLQVPKGYRMGPLLPEHALEVRNETMDHDEASLEYIESVIKYKKTLAVFTDSGELISWALGIDYANSGTVFSKEKFAHLGFASAIGVALAKDLVEIDDCMCWHVAHTNLKAMGLAEKFFAKVTDTHTWMGVKPRGDVAYKIVAPNAKFQIIM